MLVMFSVPDIVDDLTVCQRRIKDVGVTSLLQPYIAKNFDENMGGVDLGLVHKLFLIIFREYLVLFKKILRKAFHSHAKTASVHNQRK